MIKYYCDWCNTEIKDDNFVSERMVTMPFVNAEKDSRMEQEDERCE